MRSLVDSFFNFYVLMLERMAGRRGKKERNIIFLFHLIMYSLVDSCTCPDQALNLQPWCIGMMI